MSPLIPKLSVRRCEIPLPLAAGFSHTLLPLALAAASLLPIACNRASTTSVVAAQPAIVATMKPQDVGRLSFTKLTDFKIEGKVAEIAAATPDGLTLAYTDSQSQEIGFIDIAEPAKPRQIGALKVGGEPTSVAITPDGEWLLGVVRGEPHAMLVIDIKTRTVAHRMVLGGQPDCVAISPDGKYAAIAIENERQNPKAPMPQSPPGFLIIINLRGAPTDWKPRQVPLTGLADRFRGDPEPEFISINSKNEAAVTLQENNHVVIIDLPSGKVTSHWSTGTTSHAADLKVDENIDFSDQLAASRREPDAIAWTHGGNLITANEGDYDLDLKPGEYTGGRNWTLFSSTGKLIYDDQGIEKDVAIAGLYPDKRSARQGVEPEGAAVAQFDKRALAFIGCERAGGVAVYDISLETVPKFLQVLPTGERPEGLLPIAKRSLFITANEGDGTLSIFRYQ